MTKERPEMLDPLIPAIANIRMTRDYLLENEKRFGMEAELLYQLTSLVMEINQYLNGGFLSTELIDEKTKTINRYCESIYREVFD